MFGDVGQGFVGLALGLLINSGKIKFFAPYKKKNFGTVFILAGAASMVAGFLYGRSSRTRRCSCPSRTCSPSSS